MSQQQRPMGEPDAELSALWHEAVDAVEPPSQLDATILAAARAALAAPAPKRRQAPWWKAWLAPVSVAAVAVVGLSVTLRVADEDERQRRQEMQRDEMPKAVQSPPPAPAPSSSAPEPLPAKALSNQAKEAAPPIDERAERRREPPAMRQEVAPKPFPAAPSLAEPAVAPARSGIAETRGMAPAERRASDQLQDRAAVQAAPPPSQAPAVQGESLGSALGRMPARQPEAEAAAKAGGLPSAGEKSELAAPPRAAAEKKASRRDFQGSSDALDAASPEVWLARIRQLRDAGRIAEAAASLKRFREAYPATVLPDDLARDERLSSVR